MEVTRVVRGCVRRHGKGMPLSFRVCSEMSRPLHRGGTCSPRFPPRHLHRVSLPYVPSLTAVSAPEARAPDRRLPARTRRPGARGDATARRPTWSVSPGQGCTHLMGRNSPNTRGERGTGLRTRGVDGCGSPTLPARVGQTYAAQKGVWSQRIALRRC